MKKLLLATALCCVAATPAFALFDTDSPGIVQTNQARRGASVTATTGDFSATLAAVPGKTQNFCGFVVTSGGTTSAAVVNVSVTGTPNVLNFAYVFPSSGQGVLGVALPQCIEASAPNTAITVSVPGGGTGTTAALTVWGYQR
jgi:hypothetical protein